MVYNDPDKQYKVVYNYLFSITTIWVNNDPGRDAASKKDCNMADIMYPPLVQIGLTDIPKLNKKPKLRSP